MTKEQLVDEFNTTLTYLKPEHEEIILSFATVLLHGLRVFKEKQYDYGPGNVAGFGDVGIAIRLNDKLERLKNLMFKATNPKNESIEDTWIDIGNYGFIGLMCKTDKWPNVTKYKIVKEDT